LFPEQDMSLEQALELSSKVQRHICKEQSSLGHSQMFPEDTGY